MNYAVLGYLLYLAVSVGTTVWVARILHKNGRLFLIDAFGHNEKLADSTNTLLVVGFYLINVGYVSAALKWGSPPLNLMQMIEFVATKTGAVLIILGILHLGNLFVFSRIRRRAVIQNAPPPVEPQRWVTPPHAARAR